MNKAIFSLLDIEKVSCLMHISIHKLKKTTMILQLKVGMISQLVSGKKTGTFFKKQYSSELNSQKIIVLLYNLLLLTVLTYSSAPNLKR